MNELTMPNMLTITRLVLSPVIFCLILASNPYMSFLLFVIALLTDFFDGYLARKHNQYTPLGKILDPISDKLLYAFVLFAVLIKNHLYFWIGFFGAVVIAYLIVGIVFFKKKIKITKIGRFMLFLESVVLAFMIFGFINDALIILFILLILVPASDYIYKLIHSKK